MAMGFFMDVLEVESVDERKGRDPRFPQSVTYARLRLAGGSLSVKVRDGVKIAAGWSGKASGSARVVLLKREFNGRLSDSVALSPVELDAWVPVAEVRQSAASAIDSFLGKK